MEQYASIRFIIIWVIATKLSSIILEITTISKMECHWSREKRKRILKIWVIKARLATLWVIERNQRLEWES
jgi:hypothetical protein